MERTICGFLFENVTDYDQSTENFDAEHGTKDIAVYRDDNDKFYISVYDTNQGCFDADGWCNDDIDSLDAAIEEMINQTELNQSV